MLNREKIIVLLLGLMSLFYLISGVALHFFSQLTFDTMPGYYGVFNNHFIKDAGLAFSSSGILLAIALFRENERLSFSFCASIFVVLHGLFHVQMLLGGMIPGEYVAYELMQVIVPAIVLMVLIGAMYYGKTINTEIEYNKGINPP